MNKFEYTPQGVCSKKMVISIENNYIKDVQIIGGCPGNTLGISLLIKDRKVDEIIDKLKNIKCGNKSSSCPAELAKALQKYKNSITK